MRARGKAPAREEFRVKLKRLIGLVLCAALAFSMAACKFAAPANVMTVDGREIPAGLYLVYQYQAYMDAMNQREDRTADVLKTEIDGMKAADWIHAETVGAVRRYVWTQQAFEAAGLSFTQEERDTINARVDSIWEANEALLAANGIGRESYGLYCDAEEKYAKLLEEYRDGPNGQVTDAEARAYMDQQYSRAQILTLPSTDANYTLLDGDKRAELDKLAAGLADRLNAGGSLDELAGGALEQAFTLCGREYSEESLSSYLSANFFTEDTVSYSADLTAAVLAAPVGGAGVYDGVGMPMVYQRIDNYEDNDDFKENYRGSIVSEMTAQAFADKADAEAAAYAVEEDASAVRAYSPSKVKASV